MLRYIGLTLLALAIVKNLVALSKDPWTNKTVVLSEKTACQSYPFQGGFKPYSKVSLKIFADKPVWVVVHDGQRFIRENYTATRKSEFNFIGLNGFEVLVCREGFYEIQQYFKQQLLIANGAEIPEEEIFPALDSEKLSEFNIYLNSN